MNPSYITVTQLTRYIKYKIDNDNNLSKVYLKGEISNFKAHTSGHYYFTIKDENSRINAVMFSSSARNVKFMPKEGMKVLVRGKISVYESTGSYQIYVDEMMEDGLGNLYVAFEQLKEKLQKEGLFDPSKKKPIPKMPKTIGIITAPTGAAIKDILSTIKRRWPIAQTILFPSLVQGEEAKIDLVKNINLAKTYPIDVLIIGRGGGSIEDLWPFNEEIVARAIYDIDIPVISAVGHEIDYTICDFVADLRAPTPTGAAEMAVPSYQDVITYIKQLKIRSIKNIQNIITLKSKKLNTLEESYVLQNPLNIYAIKMQKYDSLYEKLIINYRNIIQTNNSRLKLINNNIINSINKTYLNTTNKYNNLINKLEILNPLITLKRGYTIIEKDNKVISSSKLLNKDDLITIKFQDGKINTKVI